MVTSSLGSSFSKAQEEVKEAVPPSVSHLDPKPSPTVNGLSLYLKRQTQFYVSPLLRSCGQNTKSAGKTRGAHALRGSGGESRLIEHVQLGTRGGLGPHGALLLDYLHL